MEVHARQNEGCIGRLDGSGESGANGTVDVACAGIPGTACGSAEIEEIVEDAVIAAVHDQTTAGLDVITDGEQTRLDFNLSFYGFLHGLGEAEISSL